MSKEICYEELCGTDDRFHLRTWIVIGLVAAVLVAVWIVTNNLISGIENMNFPFLPTEY